MVTWQKVKRDLIPPLRCQDDEAEGTEAEPGTSAPADEQVKELPKKSEKISIVVTKSSDAEGEKVEEPISKVIFPAKETGNGSKEKHKSGGSNSATESTKGKESVNSEEAAPFNTILDFLSSLLTKNYPEALRLSKTILKYEPNNKTVAEFLNVLEEVVAGGLLEDSSSGSSSSSSSSSDSESSSSSSSSSSSDSESSDSESECGDSENDWQENALLSFMAQREQHEHRCRPPSSQTTTTNTTNTSGSSSRRSKMASAKGPCQCYADLRRKILASTVRQDPPAEMTRRAPAAPKANRASPPPDADFMRQTLNSSGTTSSSDSSDIIRHSIIASAMSGSACTDRSFGSMPSTLTPLPSDVNRSLMGSSSSLDAIPNFYDGDIFEKAIVTAIPISPSVSSSGDTTDDGNRGST